MAVPNLPMTVTLLCTLSPFHKRPGGPGLLEVMDLVVVLDHESPRKSERPGCYQPGACAAAHEGNKTRIEETVGTAARSPARFPAVT